MNNKVLFLTILIASMSISSISVAGEVEVTWTAPEKYRDIRAGEENRKRFKARTFSALEKHLAKLSMKLPQEQLLKINVTDVDLAGDTLHGGIQRIRIIKDIYFPRLKFSYQLLNKADGKVIISEEVNLKDMGFMQRGRLKYNNQSLSYEKVMLDNWFNKTFKEIVN